MPLSKRCTDALCEAKLDDTAFEGPNTALALGMEVCSHC